MTVILELTPEVEARLQEQARARGLAFEEHLNRVLEEAAPAPSLTSVPANEDPLLRLAGAFTSDVTDAAERHDYYIGQALYKEMRGESDG